MLKHFIPTRTLTKFQIFCANKNKWADRLQEHISAEVLPPRFGGTNEEFERVSLLYLQVVLSTVEFNRLYYNLIS